MIKGLGKFTVNTAATGKAPLTFETDGIKIGRLPACEVVLDHNAVSRIHAAINYQDARYVLVNLSSSNVLTLNGRTLGPKQDDVLTGGDTIQIGPFTILAELSGAILNLVVREHESERLSAPSPVAAASADKPDVLDVFWEKRTREKEDWGTRLRPTEKPIPGKAMYNWRPTRDLRRPWRYGLFVWSFLLIGALGVFAYYKYPQTYAPKPLANPHALRVENSTIAIAANGNSCTTCHAPNEPMENSCVRCHQASEFHASNTKAHEDAGITCTVCHQEHRGADFQLKASAIQSCAACHNDANSKTYNGNAVHTAHGGSYGYAVVDGKWQWKGVYTEAASLIPEVNSSATGDADEQAKLSRQFHTIHVARLKAPEGMKGDGRGLVSCSTCHDSFDPIDRTTPRQTCAACHTTSDQADGRDMRFASGAANCITCHVQHPFSSGRWSEFLTDDAKKRRVDGVAAQIKKLNGE